MRVRDIVRGSFDRLIEGGALPHYKRLAKAEVVGPGLSTVGLYADRDAWRRAVAFVRAFTAASATAGARAQWQIPAWSGSFGEMTPEDLLHHLAAGLGGCGLRPLASSTPARMACFEAIDSAPVSALPAPYGRWFEIEESRSRWRDKIDLRLVVCARARIVPRRDGRFDAFADLALSGPAIELMQELGAVLDRSPPPIAAARWLPRSPLTAGRKHDRVASEGV
ncbi:MAG: hypothetical protein U1E60_11345 [Reyranellaceae bacterium]